MIRRFQLIRTQDVTGVSGTGLVAEGVQFSDGVAVVRWCVGDHRSTVVWESVDAALAVHGHGGNTVLKWLDQPHAGPDGYGVYAGVSMRMVDDPEEFRAAQRRITEGP